MAGCRFLKDSVMRVFGVLCCVVASLVAFPLGSAVGHEKDTTPCAVDVIFGDDNNEVFTAFVLKLQHKNKSLRVITGVSVLIQDDTGEVVKNSDALCNVDSGGIAAGSTGQCEKVLQIITGRMAAKVGYDIWVKMIDDQKKQLLVARKCEVLGVKYL